MIKQVQIFAAFICDLNVYRCENLCYKHFKTRTSLVKLDLAKCVLLVGDKNRHFLYSWPVMYFKSYNAMVNTMNCQ